MPDIGSWLHRSDGSKRTPGLAQKIALDIARGLQFLHERHIVHLDLKSPNGEAAAASTGIVPTAGCSQASNPQKLLPHCRLGLTFTTCVQSC
jgi:serine/threonine protein kinase